MASACSSEAAAQPGEPGSSEPTNSIWYRWVAPQNGSVAFDTCGSNFDTVLSVFRGSAVASLTVVKSDDDRDVAVLHKAGWISTARHDTGLVFWRGGVFVAGVMTWNGNGVGRSSDVLAGRVAELALARFRALARRGG